MEYIYVLLYNLSLDFKLKARTSVYLLGPIVVRSGGHYFIAVRRSLDMFTTVRYVENGTESANMSKILKDSKRALHQNRQFSLSRD